MSSSTTSPPAASSPPPAGPVPRSWLIASAVAMLLIGTATFTYVMRLSDGYLFRHDGTGYFLYTYSIVTDFDTEVTDDYLQLNARVPPGSPAMSGLRTRRPPVPDHVILPWPIGPGLVMAPFYAAGYSCEWLLASVSGREPDPFGFVPQWAYGVGSLFYGWLGIWATYLCCRRLTGSWLAWGATLALLAGGPAVFYIFFHPTMAHAASLGLVAVFILLWWRRWDGESVPIAWLGLLAGLMVIVRYQNAIFGILLAALLLREIYTRSWREATLAGVIASLAFVMPLSLQLSHVVLVEREAAAAHWQSEDLTMGRNLMDLSSPFFFDALFSCRHGAIIWAPIIAVALLGLLAAVRGGSWARLFLLVFLADVYLIGCLRGPPELMVSLDAPPSADETNWSGGHAFGMRYLTECMPLLAAGLAVLLSGARLQRLRHRTIAGWATAGAAAILVVWNGLLLLAYGVGTIDRVECVTWGEMLAGVGQALGKLL
ncbi:MAG: hypothetical protein AAF560_26305 [Acidobacteriota bacterium]